MKKTLAFTVALLAIFSMSATNRPTTIPSSRTSAYGRLAIGPQALIHPFCGPNIYYQKFGSDPISYIKIQGPGMTTVTHTSPTLPFAETYGSFNPTITIQFTSGSGSLQLTWDDNGGSLVDCETYAAPYLSPVTGSLTCGFYTLTITHNGGCD
ncbi:MAG TPA: hypothetical protein VHD83_12435 [Puia sp.]|nr:hypothetical protein [Puia sp.]